MNRHPIWLLTVLALLSFPACADEKKAEEIVFDDVPPAEEKSAGLMPLGGSLYLEGEAMTDYVYRGRRLGTGSGVGRLDLVFPLGGSTTLGFGGKYVGGDDYEEAQGFFSLDHSFGPISAALGYRYYGLDADDRNELGLMIGTVLGGVNLRAAYYYDMALSGHYFEAYGQREWRILDPLALRATATLSGASSYWFNDSGLNHAEFRLDFPVYLREWITLTPWVSATWALDAIDAVEYDNVYGGISLKMAF